MKKALLLVAVVLSLCGCKLRTSSNGNSSSLTTTESVVEESPVVKDSIDVLIEQRAEQEFNSTIFAGLRFGSSKQAVDRALKDNSKKVIHLIEGDDVRQVIVRDYDADYYNGELASLTLYADETHMLNALNNLYASKYGETKKSIWEFKDAEISLDIGYRSVYKAADGWNPTTLYYDSYGGSNTTAITRSSSFLKITYRNNTLLNAISRQIIVKDSLENERRIKEEQKQKEIERKLAEEAANNI